VTGELSGDSAANLRLIFERWMPNGFPGLLVLYKGRGLEWYPAELPVMFDWLSRKKRAHGTATLQLGTGPRFPWTSMRNTDTRFYWRGVERTGGGPTREPAPAGKPIVPAEIQGDIKGSNVIDITNNRGVTQLSIWLSQDMIDWSKPVTVNIGGRIARDSA